MVNGVEQTLRTRAAIVTGAGRGIGEVIALTLARRGADVVVNDLHAEALGSVAARISSETEANVVELVGDISSRATATALAAAAADRFGGCDILVNNAGGTLSEPSLTEDTPEDRWRAVIDTNLTGSFFCAQAVLPGMRERGYGRIINISSTAGFNLCATPVAAYTAAKTGLIGFTRHLGLEAAPWGITTNCVCPGHIATPRMLAKEAADEDARRQLTRQVPVGRLGTPEDIAEAVAFLASEQAGFICGTTLLVDGGLLLGYVPRDEWIQRPAVGRLDGASEPAMGCGSATSRTTTQIRGNQTTPWYCCTLHRDARAAFMRGCRTSLANFAS